MKNKILKKIAVFAACLLTFGCVMSTFGLSAVAENASVKVGDRKTLFGFETEIERAGIQAGYIFGAVKRSDEHVTEGKKSLYLQVEGHSDEDNELHLAGGDFEFWSSNYIGISTADEMFMVARDISEYDTLSMDFYNDSDRDTSVTVFLQTNMQGTYNHTQGSFQRVGRKVLPKGKVSYLDFDLTYLQYSGLDEIMRYWFFFDNINPSQTPLKLYLDNVAVERKQENFKIDIPTVGDDLKLTSFENKIETQIYTLIDWGVAYEQLPVMEWNTNPDYVSDGESSLKVTLNNSNHYCRCSGNKWGGSWSLSIPAEYLMKGLDLNEMLKQENKTAENFELLIDVYNPCNQQLTISIGSASNHKFPANSWTTVRTNLSDYQFATSGQFGLGIASGEFRDIIDRIFYVDNIRIEEVAQ